MEAPGRLILWHALVQVGSSLLFGCPSRDAQSIWESLGTLPDLQVIAARHEQAACHMADGFARASGRPGVVLAPLGPGATSLITGLATAMLDSVPLVAIVVQTSPRQHVELDLAGLALPVTKHTYEVRNPQEIAATVREAFAVARHGRPGPVLLTFTFEALEASASLDEPPAPSRHDRHGPGSPSETQLAQVLDLIRTSQRPLILAGHGVILSGASRELRHLAERARIPIATTLLGLAALPASHPLHLGMIGMHGEAWGNQAIQEADLILAFGMRFDDRVTGDPQTFAPRARKVHVDIDASEMHKTVPVDVPLVADLRETLVQLLARLEPVDHAAWIAHLADLKTLARPEAILEAPGGLRAPQVLWALSEATQGQALMVTDVGQHQMWEAQYYRHEQENSLVTSGGLGTMGFALPAAIGAQLACPHREVWAVMGDGGFQMNVQELLTLAREGLPIRIAVVNNGYLGMVRQLQEFFCEGRYAAVTMANPDFVKLAEAYGIPSERVTDLASAPEAIARARAFPGPCLLEFQVEPELSVYPMVPAGASLDAMLRRHPPRTEAPQCHEEATAH